MHEYNMEGLEFPEFVPYDAHIFRIDRLYDNTQLINSLNDIVSPYRFELDRFRDKLYICVEVADAIDIDILKTFLALQYNASYENIYRISNPGST